MNTLLSTDGETRTLKRIALESKPSMFTNFITSAQRLRLKSKILTPQAAPVPPLAKPGGVKIFDLRQGAMSEW